MYSHGSFRSDLSFFLFGDKSVGFVPSSYSMSVFDQEDHMAAIHFSIASCHGSSLTIARKTCRHNRLNRTFVNYSKGKMESWHRRDITILYTKEERSHYRSISFYKIPFWHFEKWKLPNLDRHLFVIYGCRHVLKRLVYTVM